MLNDIHFKRKILQLLGIKQHPMYNLFYLLNDNLKNSFIVTCDNRQMILGNDQIPLSSDQKNQSTVIFRPFEKQEESCTRLIINDSIHFYLRNTVYSLFNKIITIKDGTHPLKKYSFDKTHLVKLNEFYQLEKLENPTKNTKYKFYNLFNIVTATSFSKNLISFSIDLTNSPKNAKVDFKYPLYDMLSTIQNNTIYGIYLEDFEIKLFKQIYENYIIDTIDNLFKDTIKIPENSSNYPQLYVLLTIKLRMEETFWKKYNICYIGNMKNKLPEYEAILSDLNPLNTIAPLNSEHQQKLDQQSYRNELDIRKESEPNWLLLKDSTMQKSLNNQEIEPFVDKKVEEAFKIMERGRQKYMKQIDDFLRNESVKVYKEDYQKMKNHQEWSEIFHWQNLVLGILKIHGGALWFDTRIHKYCFRSKIGSKIVEKDKDQIGELLTRALSDKITNFLNRNNNGFLYSYAIEIVFVSKLKGINNQTLNVKERASNVIKIFVFENEILTIDDDRFDTQNPYEFSKNHGDLFYTQNRFIPTKYLRKRFDDVPPNLLPNKTMELGKYFSYRDYLFEKNEQSIQQFRDLNKLSFIEKFIFHLVNADYHIFYYVMNWLAVFFNSLQKSGTALVLLGDQEVTQNIFWDKIIKEIFGLQYCITINDKTCKTASYFDIAKDRLFFHIGDITNAETKFDDQTLFKLVKYFLVNPSIVQLNENNENEKTPIHGQMIITAKNPFPYIKRAMSKCTIIKANDMDTIIDKLGIPDEVILEDEIEKDLDNFTDILQSFSGDVYLAKYAMDTEDRWSSPNHRTSQL